MTTQWTHVLSTRGESAEAKQSIEQSHADIAAELDVSVEVVKTTIHRWRKRFREIVKSHIASTVSNVSEVDEELGYLIQALAATSRE